MASQPPPKSSGRKRVGIILNHLTAHNRGIAEGITAYVTEKANWEVFLADHVLTFSGADLLKKWNGDGLIGYTIQPEVLNSLREQECPLVLLNEMEGMPADAGKIWSDDAAIGRMAADALMERGFERFGVVHDKRYFWSQQRLEGFLETTGAEEFPVDILKVPSAHSSRPTWMEDYEHMIEWVKNLGSPVAVFCTNDVRAQQVLEACRESNLRVPDEIAVLGVDNDELLCRLTMPSLSSVQTETRRIGYNAAQLLDKMMSGEPAPAKPILVKPAGVVDRASTDITAISDELVSQAMAYIREHACEGIKVGDVLGNLKVSRRLLESRFSKLLGYTPHEAIQRVRFRRVRELLANTKLTLEEIAALTGFQHVEYLSASFKKWAGQPPSAYRAEQQANIAPRPPKESLNLTGAFS